MLKVQEIREIIRLIDQSSINEFTYETNDASLTLKKSDGQLPEAITAAPPVTEQQPQVISEPPVKQQQVVEEVKLSDKEVVEDKDTTDYDVEITSPMVGTFYRASSPENDPYVEIGSNVTEDSVVCIVEAMKLFNEIEAETKGEIVEILVEDGELVEYGQPLFRVKKN